MPPQNFAEVFFKALGATAKSVPELLQNRANFANEQTMFNIEQAQQQQQEQQELAEFNLKVNEFIESQKPVPQTPAEMLDMRNKELANTKLEAQIADIEKKTSLLGQEKPTTQADGRTKKLGDISKRAAGLRTKRLGQIKKTGEGIINGVFQPEKQEPFSIPEAQAAGDSLQAFELQQEGLLPFFPRSSPGAVQGGNNQSLKDELNALLKEVGQ